MKRQPEPKPWANFRAVTARDHIALRAATTDMDTWYRHISAAAGCTRPIRLSGHRLTIRIGDSIQLAGHGKPAVAATGQLLSTVDTATMPDGVIYKACGNRRASVCPACSRVYQRDAYQVLRAGLVGGKGIPESVATHPAVSVTLTAPSFGHVHSHVVTKHTCGNRKRSKRCDCRPNPCRARTGSGETGLCVHGNPTVCWKRHDPNNPDDAKLLGQPLCLDCYDHAHHVVWNAFSGELWRRTKQAAERHLAILAAKRGLSPVVVVTASGNVVERPPVAISHGKAAEMQRRGAVHFHAILRLDGVNDADPGDPDAIAAPPADFSAADLEAAIRAAAAHTHFTTPPHPDRPQGWPIRWGDPEKGTDVQHIILTGTDPLCDEMVAERVAGYLAKYATKSTEATGFQSTRITLDNIALLKATSSEHIARLLGACWRLGRPPQITVPVSPRSSLQRVKTLGPQWTCSDCGTRTRLRLCPVCEPVTQPKVDNKPTENTAEGDGDCPYLRLRRWAHMLGFGGHLLTKAQRYSVTFGALRIDRTSYRRAQEHQPPADIPTAEYSGEETILIIGTLNFAGVGWRNTGDAILAATSAAMARARRQAAKEELAHQIGTALQTPQPLAA